MEDARFSQQPFALEFSRGEMHYFGRTSSSTTLTYIKRDSNLSTSSIPVFSDITSRDEPLKVAKWNLIFSSPDNRRYKEYMKLEHHVQYIMPTWSEFCYCMSLI